jgi:HupE / UreJ protein
VLDNVPQSTWLAAFVNTMIAVSILFVALGNIVGAKMRWRWIVAGFYGLVSGLVFTQLLHDRLQFAGTNSWIAVGGFDLGITIGLSASRAAISRPDGWTD